MATQGRANIPHNKRQGTWARGNPILVDGGTRSTFQAPGLGLAHFVCLVFYQSPQRTIMDFIT